MTIAERTPGESHPALPYPAPDPAAATSAACVARFGTYVNAGGQASWPGLSRGRRSCGPRRRRPSPGSNRPLKRAHHLSPLPWRQRVGRWRGHGIAATYPAYASLSASSAALHLNPLARPWRVKAAWATQRNFSAAGDDLCNGGQAPGPTAELSAQAWGAPTLQVRPEVCQHAITDVLSEPDGAHPLLPRYRGQVAWIAVLDAERCQGISGRRTISQGGIYPRHEAPEVRDVVGLGDLDLVTDQ